MRIPRIHTDQALHPQGSFVLEPGPSQHLARALRMQAGDALVLFDGRGGEYPAVIAEIERNRVTVTTEDFNDRNTESPLQVHLGIAVSRGERMDWVIQKATELGVAGITVLMTERTEVKLKGDREAKKLRHWQQIAVSACEQCGRNRVPDITGLSLLPTWLENVQAERKLVLHHRADSGSDDGQAPNSVALLIGPEGGLSDTEITVAENHDFSSIALGPRVLRTETAPLAALAILQARWGDMNPEPEH